MSQESFDIVVIGSGPGGYVSAIRCAQLGFKTALIEKSKHLGGTCLNVGCIPSKALLHSTEMLHFAKDQAASHGFDIPTVNIDIAKLMERKSKVVDQLRGGVQQLTSKRGIENIHGAAKLLGDGKIEISSEAGAQVIEAKNIIIATGSSIIELPFLKFDGETIVSSDDAIAFDEIPEKLVVVGGGAIGLELGSVWSRLGSEVTVVEFLPKIAPTFDDDVSKMVERIFKKQGLKFETNTKCTGVRMPDGEGKAILTAEKKGKEVEYEADKILVAVGRKPHTEGLGLENVGISLDEKGRIPVDSHFKTSAPGIYAIGDVIPGPMLAHKAEEEGVAVAELLAGKAGHVNYDVIPNVIYTEPEVASVGITEQQAKEHGLSVNTGKFPLAANGRAIATDATDGFVKVIADSATDKLLGIQIISKGASEMIASSVTHMEYGGSAEDIARTIHAHPTISESIKEAALAVSKSSIHSL